MSLDLKKDFMLFGRWKIIESLGKGTLGEVYKAYDEVLGRYVAIKRLRPDIAFDTEVIKRFEGELRTIAGLNHPGIVTLYDFWRDPKSGDCFSIMEYVEEGNLRKYIEAELLSVIQSLDIVIDICDPLEAVHRKNIIHNDLKPDNILLNKREGKITPKICDFGAMASGRTALTGYRTFVYASPEELSRDEGDSDDIDIRSDLYSLGTILYEMLTGTVPFPLASDLNAWLAIVLHEEPTPPSHNQAGISPSVDDVVLRALQKAPGDRYQTARDMAEDLKEAKQAQEEWEARIKDLHEKAEHHLDQEEWGKAVELYEQIREQNHADQNVLEKLKMARDQQLLISLRDQIPQKMKQGLWQEAKDQIGEALKIVPNDVTLTTWEEDIDDQLTIIKILEQAQEAKRKTDWPKVVALCREARDLDPDHAAASSLLEQAEIQYRIVRLRQRADTLLKRRNHEAALEKLNRLFDLDPTNEDLKAEIQELQKTVSLEVYYSQGKRAHKEKRWKDAIKALEKVLATDAFYCNGEAAALKSDAEKQLKETRGKPLQEIIWQFRRLSMIFNFVFKWFRKHWKPVLGAILPGMVSLVVLLLTVENETPLGMMREKVITYFSDTPTSIPRSIGETAFIVNGVTVANITQPHYITETRQISIIARVQDTYGEIISDDEILCEWTFDPWLPKETIVVKEDGCQTSYEVPENLNSQLVEVKVQGKDITQIAGTSTNFINIVLQSDRGGSNE